MPVHNFVHSHGESFSLDPNDQASTDMQALPNKTCSSQAPDLITLCASATGGGNKGMAKESNCTLSGNALHHKQTFKQNQAVSFELLPDISDSDKHTMTLLRQKLSSVLNWTPQSQQLKTCPQALFIHMIRSKSRRANPTGQYKGPARAEQCAWSRTSTLWGMRRSDWATPHCTHTLLVSSRTSA